MTELLRVLVCDYESAYRFPSNGYGSIERWLATVAKYLSRLGHEVIISGPLWNHKYLPDATWWPQRLNRDNAKDFLRVFGKVNLLVAGHEAFGNPEWDEPYLEVADRCVSYQHGLELYGVQAYEGIRKQLFCFSDEMMQRFHDQTPSKMACYSEGPNEIPLQRNPEGYLAWIGRLDGEKAVHFAIEASKKLRLDLVVMGELVRDPEYFHRVKRRLGESHVKWLGTVIGPEKMERLARASCVVYTCSPIWIEAAAAVLWETLLSGVPIAGMSWRGGESVVEAIGDHGGFVANVRVCDSETVNVLKLCDAIEKSLLIGRQQICDYSHMKFDPIKHVTGLISW